MMEHDASILILVLLGAAHGLNPAMGWLFAVSLGLQEQRRSAVWGALPPLALGHGLAIAVAVAAAALLGVVMPLALLQWVVAGALVGMGVVQLSRHRHPRLRGMRVGAGRLAVWSFLMATAHGAGLMAVPFVLRSDPGSLAFAAGGTHVHGGGVTGGGDPSALLGTVGHTVGYLVVAALIAAIVYEKLGLRLLRTAWINLDLVWAVALILTGVLTPLF